ncbi:reverse transcriptase domain-containing protein [Tanacetum coccineum]
MVLNNFKSLQDKVVDALSRKQRVKPRRVRAMAMTIQYGVRGMILAAQSEAFKQENILAERLHDNSKEWNSGDDQLRLRWMIYLVVLADAAEIGEDSLIRPELVQKTTDKVVVIKEKLKAARDRQKSYSNNRRKQLEFKVGNRVMLKVSPWKGVVCFGKKSKLAPRYVGPFEILERIGPIAYQLRLSKELSGVHDMFHVSNLKKCLVDASLHVPLDEIKVDKTLCFVEEPVEIMDREIKSLKRSKIITFKVTIFRMLKLGRVASETVGLHAEATAATQVSVTGTVFGEPPCPFDYPMRRLTMEEMLAKFIDEGRREHEEMEIFIKEFRTTNELLLKTRSNLLSELKIEVNELSKVVSNVLIPKNEVKGVTTRGGKITSEATRSKEINEIGINENEPPRFEQDVQEKPHDDGEKNKSSSIRERTTQPLVKPQQSSVPFPNRVRKEKEEALQRNFLENLKQLDINIPFIEALMQIPKYAKYLKILLTNKSRLEEACMETTNERCSTVLLNELPSKEKDPRNFTIPCQVLEKHKEAEDLATDHSSRLENPHMEVLTEREIADKFSDEHLMALKSKSNNDEPWYADFVNYIVGKVVPPNWTFEKRKRFFSQVKTYFWEEPYAFKLYANNIMRRCAVRSETLEILAHCHLGPTGGHHSANVTEKKVYESRFYWPSVFKDANEYVRRCDACQRSRNISSRNEMPQNNIQMYPGKLKSKWSGPNHVKTVYPHGAIEITDRDGFRFKVNGQRLKKYYGGDIDKEDDDVIELENDTMRS